MNKVPFTAAGSATVSASEIKNGAATFRVFAPGTPPTPPDPADICPSGRWTTVTLQDIEFSNVVLTLSHGGQTLTCTYPGTVPKGQNVTLSCS